MKNCIKKFLGIPVLFFFFYNNSFSFIAEILETNSGVYKKFNDITQESDDLTKEIVTWSGYNPDQNFYGNFDDSQFQKDLILLATYRGLNNAEFEAIADPYKALEEDYGKMKLLVLNNSIDCSVDCDKVGGEVTVARIRSTINSYIDEITFIGKSLSKRTVVLNKYVENSNPPMIPDGDPVSCNDLIDPNKDPLNEDILIINDICGDCSDPQCPYCESIYSECNGESECNDQKFKECIKTNSPPIHIKVAYTEALKTIKIRGTSAGAVTINDTGDKYLNYVDGGDECFELSRDIILSCGTNNKPINLTFPENFYGKISVRCSIDRPFDIYVDGNGTNFLEFAEFVKENCEECDKPPPQNECIPDKGNPIIIPNNVVFVKYGDDYEIHFDLIPSQNSCDSEDYIPSSYKIRYFKNNIETPSLPTGSPAFTKLVVQNC